MDNSNNETQGLGLNTQQPENLTPPTVDPFNANPPTTPVQTTPVEPVVNPTVVPEQASPTPVVEPAVAPVEAAQVAPTQVAPVMQEQTSAPVQAAPQSMDLNTLMAPDSSQGSTPPPTENTVSPSTESTVTQPTGESSSDDELVKAFIGAKYNDFVNNKFNIFAFLFTWIYLVYRKMFLYGFLLVLVQGIFFMFVNIPYAYLIINVLVGIFANQFYVKFAKAKVEKIKAENAQKSHDELIATCTKKGGVSVAALIVSIIITIIASLIILIVGILIGLGVLVADQLPDFLKTAVNTSNTNNTNSNTLIPSSSKKIENANIVVQLCAFGVCQVSVSDASGNDYTIVSSQEFNDLSLIDFKEYLTIDIYYTESGGKLNLSGYKIYDKETKEEISVSSKAELVSKLGLYDTGVNTASMKMVQAYGTYAYDFVDSHNRKYYLRDEDGVASNLVVGNTYKVTFEVDDSGFETLYYIKSIE